MTTSTTTASTKLTMSATAAFSEQPLRVDGTDPVYNDWRDDLIRDGYAVIKGAIPQDKVEKYADRMYSLIEGFGLGYDRKDPSTVHPDKLPVINEKGMLFTYAACHEDFVWDIRAEPGIVSAFEKVYQDEDLIVSFDAINYGFANRTNLPKNTPWPHQDQDPEKPGFRCLQGLVNLHRAGPNDGGLIVCKGAHLLSEEYHKDMREQNEERIPAWTPEWYGYKEAGMKWLEDRGCEWYKVEAEAGDLIVWDSRTPHYNVPTTSDVDRLCIYTCYMPVKDATQEELIRKKDAFNNRLGTTHWPNARNVGWNEAKRNGVLDTIQRSRPSNEPVLDERAFKLTGIPYIKATA